MRHRMLFRDGGLDKQPGAQREDSKQPVIHARCALLTFSVLPESGNS